MLAAILHELQKQHESMEANNMILFSRNCMMNNHVRKDMRLPDNYIGANGRKVFCRCSCTKDDLLHVEVGSIGFSHRP